MIDLSSAKLNNIDLTITLLSHCESSSDLILSFARNPDIDVLQDVKSIKHQSGFRVYVQSETEIQVDVPPGWDVVKVTQLIKAAMEKHGLKVVLRCFEQLEHSTFQ